MATVITYRAEDLLEENIYIAILDTGQVQVKDATSNQLTKLITPSEKMKDVQSAGGRATNAKKIEAEIDSLLDSMGIPKSNPEARYLSRAAISKKGDATALRAFLRLSEKWLDDKRELRPVQRIYLSDAAFDRYIGLMCESGYIQDPYWDDKDNLSTSTDDLRDHEAENSGDVYVEHDILISQAIDKRQNGANQGTVTDE